MAQISRADMLKVLSYYQGQQELQDYAEFFDYEQKPSLPKKIVLDQLFKPPEPEIRPVEKDQEVLEPHDNQVDFKYFLLESIERQQITSKQIVEAAKEVAWLDQPYKKHKVEKQLEKQKYPKDCRLLFNWQLLRNCLQQILKSSKKGHHIDIDLVIRKVSRVEPLLTLPRKKVKKQASEIRLLVDYSAEHLRPVFRDFTQLVRKIQTLYGSHYLKVQELRYHCLEEHHTNLSEMLKEHREKHVLSYLQQSKAVIIISDLGLYLENNKVLNQWLAFANIAHAYNCQPIVLLPLPERYLNADVTSVFECIAIESATVINTKVELTLEQRQENIKQDLKKAKTTLLRSLASSPYIHSDLLRANRDLFSGCDIAIEILAWNHPDVYSNSSFVCLRQEKQLSYLGKLKNLPADIKPAIRKNFVDYHGRFLSNELVVELSLFDAFCGMDFNDDLSDFCTAKHRKVAKSLESESDAMRNLFVWLFLEYYPEKLKKNNNFATVMADLLRQKKVGDAEIKPWENKNTLVYMDKRRNKNVDSEFYITLLNCVDHLLLISNYVPQENNSLYLGSIITEHLVETSLIFIKSYYQNKTKEIKLDLEVDLPYKVFTSGLQSLAIELQEGAANTTLQIAEQKKPKWVKAIESNDVGMFVTVSKGNKYYWHPKTVNKKNNRESIYRGYWYFQPEMALNRSLFEISSLARDKYGLYADLKIKKVKQRFRWIEPGEFLMGSPETELGREDNENLHKVRISQGFWFADTTCTQALWKAVMGRRKNPSSFEGDDLPVERVSWEDVKSFITKLNKLTEWSSFRLPTEAEWEYVCRAGTETPFAYGEEADSKLMNIGGKTVPATDLYQNNWGLYQMHGNVWEWCEDWYGKYDASNEVAVDPRGPNTGSNRVLRGGSWSNDAKYCRSALRVHNVPSLRSRVYGFRLISGHQEKTE